MKKYKTMVLLCSVLLLPGVVSAQKFELEEIVVTAQKREQNLQDVGVSVTALTSEDITKFRIRGVEDIVSQVPNLQMSSVMGEDTPVFSLRGISMLEHSFHQNGPVATYVDEVYKGSPALLAVPMFDIERIEVLRGPQGTLYGKNSTGGAVNLISKKPVLENEGYLTVGIGNYNLRETEGVVNVALSDSLALRLAGTWAEADGWLENVLPGVDDANSIDKYGVRLGVLWQPREDLELLLRASTAESSPVNYGVVFDGEAGPGNFWGMYSLYNAFGATNLTDPNQNGLGHFQMNKGEDAKRQLQTDSVSLTANWNLNDAYTLTSITSLDDGEVFNPEDSDSVPNLVFDIRFATETEQIAQDLRLTSSLPGSFNFVAGLNYARERVDASNEFGMYLDLDLNIDGAIDNNDCLDPLFVAFGLPPSPAGAATDALFGSMGFGLGGFATLGCVLTNSFEQEKTSYAAYFDGNYELSDTLSLRFGLRYTADKADMRNFNGHYAGNDGTPLMGTINDHSLDPLAFEPSQSNSDGEITGQFGADYTFTNGNLLYSKFSKGYRGGAYNGQAYNAPSELNWVEPEYLDSFEVGLKSTWWDGRMRLNAAAFHYRYENQIVISVDSATFVQRLSNLEKSEITGAEIEATAQLTQGVGVQLGVGLIDGEIKSGSVKGIDVSGQDLPNSSDVNVNAAIDWEILRRDAGVLTLHVDGSYFSEAFYDFNDAATADSYAIFNSRLTFDTDNWELSLWGKNLTEKEYFTWYLDSYLWGAPVGRPGVARTYGVDFTYHF